jgi:hypothetical protein
MMRILFLYFIFKSTILFSQPLIQFNQERLQTDKQLMLGLGSWASANFLVSGLGWATVPKGEAHYFHQMNVLWNTVNIGLAIPGYINAKKSNSNLTFAETIKTQQKTEKIFLFNTGLDIAYLSAGLLLRSNAKINLSKRNHYNGYGNSLLMQGGFLFLFDLTAYLLHHQHANKSLYPKMNTIELSSSGIGIKWNIGSNSKLYRMRNVALNKIAIDTSLNIF